MHFFYGKKKYFWKHLPNVFFIFILGQYNESHWGSVFWTQITLIVCKEDFFQNILFRVLQ